MGTLQNAPAPAVPSPAWSTPSAPALSRPPPHYWPQTRTTGAYWVKSKGFPTKFPASFAARPPPAAAHARWRQSVRLETACRCNVHASMPTEAAHPLQ